MTIKTLTVGPLMTNCYILEAGGEGILIDPGDEAEMILKEIAGLKIKLIIATHGHPDHIGAVSELRRTIKALFLIHPEELKIIDEVNKIFSTPSHPLPPPDLLLKDGDEIKLGGLFLKVLHTPGHSPGGICLLGEGFVFSGDTLFRRGIGRHDLPGGSLKQLLQSIKSKLLPLPQQTKVYPGHGPPTTIGEERLLNPFLN